MMKNLRVLKSRGGLLTIVFFVIVILSMSQATAFATPQIAVTKFCEDASAPGEPIFFHGIVSNPDDLRILVDVTVVDDHAGQVLGPITLDPLQEVEYSGSYVPTESPSTNTVTASGTWYDSSGNPSPVSATASATCNTPTDGLCWLTAGGVKFSPLANGILLAEYKGPKDNVGGNVYPGCSPDAGDGGSWTHIDHGLKLHFHGTDITVVECGNVPGIEPGSESPATPFNYIEFTGTGSLVGFGGNRDDFGTVCFDARAEDRNEPGNERALAANGGENIDRYFMRVYSCDAPGVALLLVDDGSGNPRTITGGNFQIHISSCDN